MLLEKILKDSTAILENVGVQSARLDALVIIGDALGQDKSWILAHLDSNIPPETNKKITEDINVRAKRVPLAYIRGKQEFYGRDFIVTNSVLIPRPETETLIDFVKNIAPKKILDVGAGSGAIAVTLAKELPSAKVYASDISSEALNIAKKNAQKHETIITFIKSDLLKNISETFDMITANLPYVDTAWQRSPETDFEPSLALFANKKGLLLVETLITQAPKRLKTEGYLLLEVDPRQHAEIISFAGKNFKHLATEGFAVLLQKR